MNVAYFLMPKRDVVWVPVDASVRHTFMRMEESGYTAIPMLDRHGCYVGAVTEGDLLRHLMHSTRDPSMAGLERERVVEVRRRSAITAVSIEADVEELFDRAIEQNFVPVQDGRGVFTGIVRRREILEYCAGVLHKNGRDKRRDSEVS